MYVRAAIAFLSISTIVSMYADTVLIDITKAIPDIVVDLRYATTNNFTGKVVYAIPVCAVHKNLIPVFFETLLESIV